METNDKSKPIKILELFSGIGGMHLAFSASGSVGEVVLSVDINTIANSVYHYNFPRTKLLNRNIQSFTAKYINELGANVILMSPPCQPFTRNGLKKDKADSRSCAFIHLLEILPDLCIEYLLIENVKGFEVSEMRGMLIETLSLSGFYYHEVLLSPHQFGVPNSRHRYYCIARKRPYTFDTNNNAIFSTIPGISDGLACARISDIVEDDVDANKYSLPENVLRKRANILDIVNQESRRSCCFTKSYGRYVEGTGSVYSSRSTADIGSVYNNISALDKDSEEYIDCIKSLQLRFFSPVEVCRLMNIPDTFIFPPNVTDKQKYNLLGNSINVKVVSELIKLLLS